MVSWRNHGLGLVFAGLTLFSLAGHVWAGHLAENQVLISKGLAPLGLGQYLASGSFGSSLFENWESEFLQMALFVLLTVSLVQRGSSESKPLEGDPPEPRSLERAPWPVRRGGAWLRLYEHSLSLALFGLFAGSFVAHWCSSYTHYVEQRRELGLEPQHQLGAHLVDSQFWFESFQNWQSEFLSITALILLTVFLREKGSAQSKDVAAPHSETGD